MEFTWTRVAKYFAPDFHNFSHTPVVIHGPYDYHQPMEEFSGPAVEHGHGEEHAVVDATSATSSEATSEVETTKA